MPKTRKVKYSRAPPTGLAENEDVPTPTPREHMLIEMRSFGYVLMMCML